MKLMIISALVCVLGTAQAEVINDPVADFLSLPIEDRYTDASEIAEVHKVSIDLNLDGQAELLVGHHKMWWGSSRGVYYFAIYKKLPGGGYKRLTKATEDLGLMFQDGLPEFNYVGRVEELNDTGLLMCYPFQGDPGFKKTQKIESRVFVSIAGDVVRVRELPGLDLSNEADQAFYRKYFPLSGKQGGYQSVSLKTDALKALGYVLPDWTKPVHLDGTEAAANQPALNASSMHLVQPPAQKKAPEPKPTTSTPNEEPSSSTPWSIIAVLIAVGLGLLWLLLKRRS